MIAKKVQIIWLKEHYAYKVIITLKDGEEMIFITERKPEVVE